MADEEKDIQKPVDADAVAEKVEDQHVEQAVAEEPEEPPRNHVAEKRGRMVATGLIAAVILCVIAVVVAGVFQLTVRLMTACHCSRRLRHCCLSRTECASLRPLASSSNLACA